MKNMPVFVFPVSLEFYLAARHTHKQLLTLYNPYDFPVDFKVLCTSPHKFSVMEPEGAIAAQSCVDIVVRYTQGANAQPGSDKFRVTMMERTTRQTLGKRDVPTRILEGEPANAHTDSMSDDFLPLMAKSAPAPRKSEERERSPAFMNPAHRYSHREPQPVNVVAVIVSVCCIAALMLPTLPERPAESQLPAWMHIGVSLKLVFSFVLGLVAMLVLRP